MNKNAVWPPALRVVFLTGGLVAVSEPQTTIVTIQTNVIGRRIAQFQIPNYWAIFPNLKALGFKVIGATFITGSDQLEGTRAPEFRTAGLNGSWPLWDTFQKWRNIVSASAKANNMRLLDIASRIAGGLQMSELRLHDLSMSYSSQLHAHLKNDPPKEKQSFTDTFSPGVYKDIHSLFWEMAVLRDVLAQFIATFCLAREGITTASSLRKSLKKSPSADVDANEFFKVTDKDTSGWMASFGAYRDCFTHSAPLHEVEGMAWAVQDLVPLTNGSNVPQLYYPLPSDAEELSSRRAKGPLFASFKEMVQNASRTRERSNEPDALEYLHNCLCRFTDLATRLIQRSPLAPQVVVLTKEDIIGEITVNQR